MFGNTESSFQLRCYSISAGHSSSVCFCLYIVTLAQALGLKNSVVVAGQMPAKITRSISVVVDDAIWEADCPNRLRAASRALCRIIRGLHAD